MSDFIVQGNTGGYYDSDGHFVVCEEYDLSDPVTRYAGGEPQDPCEIAFENFFDNLLTLKYYLTSQFSSLQEIGFSKDQVRWLDLFRYHVFKMIEVFKEHSLFEVVFGEDDYDESSS